MSHVRTKPYKAIAAFVFAFLTALGVAFDPAAAHHPVTWQEWVFVVIGSLITAYATWQVTNPVATNNGGTL
jgi:hypothetical protein